MSPGLIALALAYVLSQFFRAFLAILTELLERDIGASADDLATASGLWFLIFALMQLPVGLALDKVGPRRTAAVLLLVGGAGGAALFALATSPLHIKLAMALIGVGCSPVLMASYYIFALQYPPRQFATLAALMIGVGTLGNLLSATPLGWAVDAIGWRGALFALAAACAVISATIWIWVKDPPPVETDQKGSLLDLLKMPVLWAIFPLMFFNYAPAGGIRGLWIGPYLTEVWGSSESFTRNASLLMGIAMIAGTLAYGPLDKIFGTRKWIIFTGNTLCALTTLALAVFVDNSVIVSIALMCMIGVLGASFPVILAHARSFFPAHLTGRGVTLINLFGIGGAGVMQMLSSNLYRATEGSDPTLPFTYIFAFFGGALLLGCALYLFARDNTS